MKILPYLLKFGFLLLLFSCSHEKENAFEPKVTLKSYTDRTKSGTEQIIFEYQEKGSGKSQKVTKVFDIEANNPFLSNDKVTITKDEGELKYGQSEVSLFPDFKNSEYLINPVNEYMTDELKKFHVQSQVKSQGDFKWVMYYRSAGILNQGGIINEDARILILNKKGEQLADIYAPKGASSSAMTDDGKYLLITYGGEVGEGYQIFNQGFSLYRVADQQEVFQYDLKSTEWHLKPAVTREGMIFVAFSSSDDSYPDQYFVINAQRRIYYHAKFSREFRLRLFKIDDKGFYSNVDGEQVFKPYSSFERVAF